MYKHAAAKKRHANLRELLNKNHAKLKHFI